LNEEDIKKNGNKVEEHMDRSPCIIFPGEYDA
jgi:hypothetical protein